ncbi:MAG: hypothetical protein ACMG6E_04415, partial [Candidatus Roizmanbacteria bacterium]
MNVLLLPGKSHHNREWLLDLQKSLSNGFDEVEIIEYDQWARGDEDFDIDTELAKVVEIVNGWDEY